ncbi:MAG: (5-formylfuran-3-yl)methyl phosphate synthase [Ignisphaera sp.]|nr:(5-formylfuran-3-yl)methyl phosphate synthase [Ignisphaera sp.]MCX8168260.1 (5-formylfuran-3-yl)methyl phosphate synthase [Ignisphaera sp.]MDW8084872.1 (5-formylfuran-3-yl)methyl phosphate synthase [Ignisphaera sp.]
MHMPRLKPKLLVSIWTVDEVPEVIGGDADIIDIKDPSAGSLGLPSLDTVLAVISKVKGYKEVSVAVGDIRDYTQALSYIAYTLSSLNVNYIKMGIEVEDFNNALSIVSQIKRTVEFCNSNVNIVLVGYADWKSIGVLEPLEIIELAKIARVRVVMIDTRIKNGKSTFDHLSPKYLKEFVASAHKNGFRAAIAGGLKIEYLPECVNLGFDVIGVRTAACSGVRLGKISREAIIALKTEIEKQWKRIVQSLDS